MFQTWVRTSPLAPEGDWYKDFGSFFLCVLFWRYWGKVRFADYASR